MFPGSTWTLRVQAGLVSFKEASLCSFTLSAPWLFNPLEIGGMSKDKATETVGFGAQRLLL